MAGLSMSNKAIIIKSDIVGVLPGIFVSDQSAEGQSVCTYLPPPYFQQR